MNLIPERPAEMNGDYYCTWGCQGGAAGICEEKLFGEEGLLTTYPQELRSSVICVLDDGWDIPREVRNPEEIYWYGVGYPDPERFPSTKGMEPKDALRWLVQKILSLGFAGAGFWIPIQTSRKTDVMYDMNDYIAHWTERAKWAAYAGVCYWKADWGQHYWNNAEARENLARIVRQYAPGLWLEQAHVGGGMAPEPSFETVRERAAREAHVKHIFEYADYYRTYDCDSRITLIPTTISRLSTLMKVASLIDGENGYRHIVNVEDEVYLSAAFGCTAGIMRHPLYSDQHRHTEIIRTLNWHRIMPPFALAKEGYHIDEEWIANRYIMEDKTVWQQSAPARLSRNMPLCDLSLTVGQYQPWVVSAKHPESGAVGIYATRRTVPGWIDCWSYADITAQVGASSVPVGIFGSSYRSLTLCYDEPIGARRVFVQDLADDTAYDVTEEIVIEGRSIILNQDQIARFGTRANTEDDKSEPGFVLVIR